MVEGLGIFSKEDMEKLNNNVLSYDMKKEIKAELERVKELSEGKEYLLVVDASKVGKAYVVIHGERDYVLSHYAVLNFSNEYCYEEIYKNTLYKFIGLTAEEYEDAKVSDLNVNKLKSKIL